MPIDLKYPICRTLALDNIGDLFLYFVADAVCCNPIFGLVLYSKKLAKELGASFVQASYDNNVIRLALPTQTHVAEVKGAGIVAWVQNGGNETAELCIKSPDNFWTFRIAGVLPVVRTRDLL